MTKKRDAPRDRTSELTVQQRRFCAEYVVQLDGQAAAIAAGYSVKSARTIAAQLLAKPHIQAEVGRLESIQLRKAGITAEGVLEQLRRIAFFDIKEIYTFLPDGQKRLNHPADWPLHARMALSNYETVVRNLTSGDGKTDDVLKVRFESKLVALELLSKHLGLLTDRTEQVTELRVSWLAPEPLPQVASVPAVEVKQIAGPRVTDDADHGRPFADPPVAAPFDPHAAAIAAAMAEHGLSREGVLRMFPELRPAKKRRVG